MNGSDLKIVGTDSGSVKVDEVHNDGTTTFTAPAKETDVPSKTVAVIVDADTGKPVAKIETKAENVPTSGAVVSTTAGTTSEVKPTTKPTVVAVLNNVEGANLKVIGTGEGSA